MIQRIQSIFLAGIVLVLLLAPFFDIWTEVGEEAGRSAILTQFSLSVTLEGITSDTTTIYLLILDLAAVALATISLLSFADRKRQMMLNLINTLILISLLGCSAYLVYTTEPAANPDQLGQLRLGFFLPGIALVLNSLANRFIHRDEKLVKSVDRLR